LRAPAHHRHPLWSATHWETARPRPTAQPTPVSLFSWRALTAEARMTSEASARDKLAQQGAPMSDATFPRLRNRSCQNCRLGFTIIELMLVVVFISLLIALLLPSVRTAREPARRSQCKNNLKQITIALHNYADHW